MLLEEFGLASHAAWVEIMTIGGPEDQASFESWDSLKNHLESGRGEPEKLRHLCGAIFRYKETYASRAEDKEKFCSVWCRNRPKVIALCHRVA